MSPTNSPIAPAVVIASGGRMLVDTVNAERLGATGDVFCLVASLDTILERVGGDGARRCGRCSPETRCGPRRAAARRAR